VRLENSMVGVEKLLQEFTHIILKPVSHFILRRAVRWWIKLTSLYDLVIELTRLAKSPGKAYKACGPSIWGLAIVLPLSNLYLSALSLLLTM
jgi:hypothetical protein